MFRWSVFAVALGCLLLSAPPASRADDRRADRRRTPVVEVYERCRDAVVNISTTRIVRMRSTSAGPWFDDVFNLAPRVRNREVHSVGSGFVVHESGIVITNAHVVAQASDVRVTFADGRNYPADVIAADPDHDLAVLRVDAPRSLARIELAAPDDVLIGETVVAIGNPLGLQNTVTTGIVSAVNRDVQLTPEVTYSNLVQTDTAINPGNSGGPLLNVNGELIGVNTAIRTDAQNIGFAIPVARLWELLPDLLDVEKRERVRFGLQVGGRDARVVSLRDDAPAARSGVKRGDRIVRINGEPLRNAIDFYVEMLHQRPDSKVNLTVERDGRNLDISAPLQSVPAPDGSKLAASLLGLELAPLPPELRTRYSLARNVGLIVRGVKRGSAADRAEIVAGDVILRLDRGSIGALEDVGLSLESVTPGQRVIVEGLRLDPDQPFLWSVSLRAGAK